MKHHDRNHEEGKGSENDNDEMKEEEKQRHEEEEHYGLPPFPYQITHTPGGGSSGGGLVATLLHTAQLQEWEAFRKEIAVARATAKEREVRLAAMKRMEETRTRDLEAMETKLRQLQQELDEARKAAAAPYANGHSSSSSSRTFVGQFGKQMQALQRQVHSLTTSLPQLEARMSTLTGRDAADTKARAACTAGLEQCHMLLQSSQTAADSALAQSQRLGAALTRVTQEKEKLTVQVQEHTAREANLIETLRHKERTLQETYSNEKEAVQALDKERVTSRQKDEEITSLLTELSAVRARNLDLSFRLNEAAEAREDAHRLRIELDGFNATLGEKDEAFQQVSEKKVELERQVAKLARNLEEEHRVVRERREEIGALKKELQESRLLSQLLSRRTAGAAGAGVGVGGGGGGRGGGEKMKKRHFSRAVVEDYDEGELTEAGMPRKLQRQQQQQQVGEGEEEEEKEEEEEEEENEEEEEKMEKGLRRTGRTRGQQQQQQQQQGEEEGRLKEKKEKEMDEERASGLTDCGDPFFFGEEQEKLQVKAPTSQRYATGGMERGGGVKQHLNKKKTTTMKKKKRIGGGKNGANGTCKQCEQKPSGLSYLCQLCLQEVCAECVKEGVDGAGPTSRGFLCMECQ